MSPELGVLLRGLLADPAKLAALTPDQERRLVTELEVLVGQERPVPPAPGLAGPPPAWSEADLLTVDEAAALLRVSSRWLYRHAATLPFARKLSRKVLRFSRSGLARWLATRRYDKGAHPS
jgi:excisionase family DNA binding protein